MRKPKPFRIKPAPYWETEEPQTATLKFGVIRLYPKAGKVALRIRITKTNSAQHAWGKPFRSTLTTSAQIRKRKQYSAPCAQRRG